MLYRTRLHSMLALLLLARPIAGIDQEKKVDLTKKPTIKKEETYYDYLKKHRTEIIIGISVLTLAGIITYIIIHHTPSEKSTSANPDILPVDTNSTSEEQNFVEQAQEQVTTMQDAIIQDAQSVAQSVQNTAQQTVQTVQDAIQQTKETVQDAAQTAQESGSTLVHYFDPTEEGKKIRAWREKHLDLYDTDLPDYFPIKEDSTYEPTLWSDPQTYLLDMWEDLPSFTTPRFSPQEETTPIEHEADTHTGPYLIEDPVGYFKDLFKPEDNK